MTYSTFANPVLGRILLAWIGCLLWPGIASAQDEKLRRDVTYSTHNYKHPNKAAAARKWEQGKGMEIQAPTNVASRNYKQQQPTTASDQPLEEGIVLKANRDQLFINRNYKDQHPSRIARDRRVKKERNPMEESPVEAEPTGN